MKQFDDSLKLKDALEIYFSTYHFPNGGYHLKWFVIKIGFINISLPNTKGRIEAVKIHDIHHVLTEYMANIKGEAEIGAWELSRGCGKYFAAWILNFASFTYGIFIFPYPLYKGFMRGMNCKSNLYSNTIYNDELLNQTLGELRNLIQLDQSNTHLVAYKCLFAFYVFLAIIFLVLNAMAICSLFEFLF